MRTRFYVVCLLGIAAFAGQDPRPVSTETIVEVGAVDSRGRPLGDLSPAEVRLLVDGNPRRVLSVRRAAGPSAVLIVVDETSLRPAMSALAAAVAGRLLVRLRPSEPAGVVRLPLGPGTVSLSLDRSESNHVLKQIVGRAEPPRARDAPASPPHPQSPDTRPPDAHAASRADMATRQPGDRQAAADAGFAGETDLLRLFHDLGELVASLRSIPGSKTLVLLGASRNGADSGSVVSNLAEAAAEGGVVIHVVQLQSQASGPPEDRVGFSHLATLAGGAFIRVGSGDPTSAVERVTGLLAARYRLVIESAPSDTLRFHALDLKPARRGVVLYAPRRWMAAPDTWAGGAAAPGQSGAGARQAETEAEAQRPATTGTGASNDRELRRILALAADYIDRYIEQFSSVVAEEHYDQRTWQGVQRRMVSDYLLAQAPEGGWVPFRDVYEVDGVKVRDREDRLRRLFIENPPAKAIDEAKRIMDESARYNLGSFRRNLNVPTLPLAFLDRAAQGRFRFSRHGEEDLDGVRLARVDYVETATPTFIRSYAGDNVSARGRFWIDPLTGRVHKTLLETKGKTIAYQATVTYRSDDAVGVWVPDTMREKYDAGKNSVTSEARYSHFRRFKVIVQETIAPPKR